MFDSVCDFIFCVCLSFYMKYVFLIFEVRIALSVGMDLFGALGYGCYLWTTKRLCNRFKPTKLFIDDDKEPSLAETAFFVAIWAAIVEIVPMIVFDFILGFVFTFLSLWFQFFF